jgi:hypothetical protein
MKAKSPLPTDLTRLQQRLNTWRQQRTKGTRIPEPLWEAAVRLARAHGPSRVGRVLQLGYAQLQGRLAGPGPVAGSTLPGPAQAPAFVEVALDQVRGPAGCTLELENRLGAKMTIRLPSAKAAPLVALAQALWRGSR